ncbi:MAG: stage II sporulation protein M [Anaerolineae bacterium]
MSTSARPLDTVPDDAFAGDLRTTLSNALIITRREVRDSFRDWRIIGPIIVLTFLFPGLAQFVAAQFASFVEGYGAAVIGTRTVPFLLMIVGFFPISISLVIALETFVGEKERRSLEPLLSTPLTNTELYIGKTLAAMLPPLLSSYGGMAVYLISLIFGDLAWRPHAILVVQIILLTTVQALAMVTGAVVVSSQTTSTRAANLLASFIIIPMTILIQAESAIMFLAPDAESPDGIGSLWAIITGMLVVVILLLRVGNSLFNREELLGRTLDKLNLKGTAVKICTACASSTTVTRPPAIWSIGTGAGSPPACAASVWRSRRRSLVFVIAFIGGYVIGQIPQWQLHLPQHLPQRLIAGQIDSYTGFFFGTNPALAIAWQNGRILLAATVIAMFTFGAGALILTPAVYVILGYILSQVVLAGYDPSFLIPAILTHGIVEIPVIVLATAAALNLGAVITRPPRGYTVGQAWSRALSDAIRIGLGLIVPGLLLAALIEAYLTPQVVRLVLGS